MDSSNSGNPRFGDSVTTTAKMSEYFIYNSGVNSIQKVMVTYKCFRSLVMAHTPSIYFLCLRCSWIDTIFSWNRITASWVIEPFSSKWCLLYYPRRGECLHWDSTTNDKRCRCTKRLHCRIERKPLLLEIRRLALYCLSQGEYHTEIDVCRFIVNLSFISSQVDSTWGSMMKKQHWLKVMRSFIYLHLQILKNRMWIWSIPMFVFVLLVICREMNAQLLEGIEHRMFILCVHLVEWVLILF